MDKIYANAMIRNLMPNHHVWISVHKDSQEAISYLEGLDKSKMTDSCFETLELDLDNLPVYKERVIRSARIDKLEISFIFLGLDKGCLRNLELFKIEVIDENEFYYHHHSYYPNFQEALIEFNACKFLYGVLKNTK